MSDPKLIKEIQAAVTIPVMAKVRIGHFVEAQVNAHLPVARAREMRMPMMTQHADAVLFSRWTDPGGSGHRLH